MKVLQRAARAVSHGVSNRLTALFATIVAMAILPASAMAAEGEGISIKFSGVQNGSLIVAFAIGLLAVLYGLLFLRTRLRALSPGDAKMQEVGAAIREGALAYLSKQIKTMSIFIGILFLGLVALYWRMGAPVAFGVGACFVLGVISSYVSGYAGMLTAVAGNMRTANAALTSYKTALETAFRSGAVAGTLTVGIGLIGASLILLLFPGVATNLLVGYAFGASLAALFMRVGGGIFTKAADVGADLVGKVEAGIPEDDPRNPAVIADNVGDNVGDCAGMAADVFESFEVTLIASIVLGAATAAIFDPLTWPRLIVFGLSASAIGLLASIIGIQMVQGSDDPSMDPLKALKRGFTISAICSFVLVGILSFTMMGGIPAIGAPIQTTELIPAQKFAEDEVRGLQAIQRDLAAKANKQPYEITAKEVLADKRARAMGFDADADDREATQELQASLTRLPKPLDLSGFTKVTDFNDPNIKALDYAIQNRPAMGQPPNSDAFTSITQTFNAADPAKKWVVAKIRHKAHVPAQPAQGSMPAQAEKDVNITGWFGPIPLNELNTQLENVQKQIAQQKSTESFTKEDTKDVSLYASPGGRLVLGVDEGVDRPSQLKSSQQLTYYPIPYSLANTIVKSASPGTPPPMPAAEQIDLAIVHHQTAPWWAFWLTLSFGILMAFAIEFITDHYVSTHKAPTREVAGVATAGAAPMIIQGFAHAATSSVFMVLAIVVALMFPLAVFSPSLYGGYTLSFYGIALVGLGLLTATAYVLAMDTFGPISDNAQGIFEMSGAADGNPSAAKVIARLDAAGNTTKALTKGFAIATAVIAAVALFHSYLEGAHLNLIGLRLDVPEIFLGLLIGGAAPYLFTAFALNAVGRSSFELINEVRRQFREDPGIMKGTSKPDYARCVAIVTAAAQKELLAPGILAIALPAAVGFGFSIGKPTTDVGGHTFNLTGAQALGGFLAGAIVSGQLMAVLLSNAGGMWDNAKKLIEDGLHGGKGTDAHKASVIGDTVGDPFKDTAGPALNPLIKVMNLVALLLSGVVIMPFSTPVLVTITAVCLIALGVSINLARKGSMSDALTAANLEANKADQHFNSNAPAPLRGGAVAEAPVPVELPEPVKVAGKKKLFVEEDGSDGPTPQ